MQQNELAALLDISPAMVSRLAKRGMPTDTVERAERWRKRHLEPGRVKGSRFGTKRKSKPATPTTAPAEPSDAEVINDLLDAIEAAGLELDKALTEGDQKWAAVMFQQVRDLLRLLPVGEWPNLPTQVWRELTAEIRGLYPPKEGNPLCEDGSPVYLDSMTENEALKMGEFWLQVAAGYWIAGPDPAPTLGT